MNVMFQRVVWNLRQMWLCFAEILPCPVLEGAWQRLHSCFRVCGKHMYYVIMHHLFVFVFVCMVSCTWLMNWLSLTEFKVCVQVYKNISYRHCFLDAHFWRVWQSVEYDVLYFLATTCIMFVQCAYVSFGTALG